MYRVEGVHKSTVKPKMLATKIFGVLCLHDDLAAIKFSVLILCTAIIIIAERKKLSYCPFSYE